MFKDEVSATVDNLRLKLAQLSNSSSESNAARGGLRTRTRTRSNKQNQMKIYFVNDLSSDSETGLLVDT